MSEYFDIAVVGAGAAGISAAVTAARSGCATLLLDSRSAAGGTGGFSGVTTLCGLFDEKGNILNGGFSSEFSEMLAETAPLQMGKTWVLPYRPEKFRESASALLGATANLQTRWNTTLASVKVEGGRIASLNEIQVGAVIDCSGTAEVGRLAGAECLATDETTQAAAVIFPLENVTRELKTTSSVMQVLLPLARAGLPPLSFQPVVEAGAVSVKFTGRPEQVPEVIEFLRKNVSGFENCSTPLKNFESVCRAGRMIIGRHVLTGADVLAGRKFDDAVARCAWPMEQWDSNGRTHYRYPGGGGFYEIPARSLRAATIGNFFMGGKVISADADGIASARVMGCCLATGEAAGQLAAQSLAATAKT